LADEDEEDADEDEEDDDDEDAARTAFACLKDEDEDDTEDDEDAREAFGDLGEGDADGKREAEVRLSATEESLLLLEACSARMASKQQTHKTQCEKRRAEREKKCTQTWTSSSSSFSLSSACAACSFCCLDFFFFLGLRCDEELEASARPKHNQQRCKKKNEQHHNTTRAKAKLLLTSIAFFSLICFDTDWGTRRCSCCCGIEAQDFRIIAGPDLLIRGPAIASLTDTVKFHEIPDNTTSLGVDFENLLKTNTETTNKKAQK
jgi:hypothetical protein